MIDSYVNITVFYSSPDFKVDCLLIKIADFNVLGYLLIIIMHPHSTYVVQNKLSSVAMSAKSLCCLSDSICEYNELLV